MADSPPDRIALNDRVFISYSNHDSATADAICASIEADGRTCWLAPRDIEPSSEWAEQIIDGINASNIMVLIFSTRSNQSPQVRREVERAINRDMPVIAFRIEKVLPSKSLEYFLSTQHWFDAFDGDRDAHIARLCRLVLTLSARRHAATDPAAHPAADSAADAAHEPLPTATDLRTAFAGMQQGRRYRDEDLAFVAQTLAKHIGPIARFLVERASAASASPAAMIESLADELADAAQRATFVRDCRERLRA